jgi:uncharacterized protein (DUF302 family)
MVRYSLFTIGLLVCMSGAAYGDGDHMSVSVKAASFEDVRESVEMAITDRGMIVNNVSHVGDMLERTGKSFGATKKIFQRAEVLEFCSAVVSRNMMEPDPDNIVFCPYTIAIYVVPEKPDEVRVAYRKPQLVGSQASRKALAEVDTLLSGIVADAMK